MLDLYKWYWIDNAIFVNITC